MKPGTVGTREQGRSAVRAIHVQPDPAALAQLADFLEIIE
jgi:hypothetical protein